MIDLRLSAFLEACDNNCAASFNFINMVLERTNLTDDELDEIEQLREDTQEISSMITAFTEGSIEQTQENFQRLKDMIEKIDPDRLLHYFNYYD